MFVPATQTVLCVCVLSSFINSVVLKCDIGNVVKKHDRCQDFKAPSPSLSWQSGCSEIFLFFLVRFRIEFNKYV